MLSALLFKHICARPTTRLRHLSSVALVPTRKRKTDVHCEIPIPEDPALQSEDYFGLNNLVKATALLKNNVHLGHKEGSRHEYMTQYIFGNRLGVDIIDLDLTVAALREALNFTAHIAYRRGVILFVSRHLQTLPWVETAAQQAGEYAHCRQWQTGTFTNATTMYGNITRLPDLVIFMGCLDTVFAQHPGISECAKMNIPTIAIADTNVDPSMISHIVPANDDSPVAIKHYLDLFAEAIRRGKEKERERAQQSEYDDRIRAASGSECDDRIRAALH